jgi:hypothetical protein
MSADRELLELAAKAAGVFLTPTTMVQVFPGFEWSEADEPIFSEYGAVGTVAWHGDDGEPAGTEKKHWNPLTDDGDALRLAADLNLKVECMLGQSAARTFDSRFAGACDFPAQKDDGCNRAWAPDRYAATRRAITLAAAEIGRAMP